MIARQTAVQTAIAMKGQRNQVVDIYNGYFDKHPAERPRKYRVKYSDMLCATYISAIFCSLLWCDICPPECGALKLYRNMEAIGRASADVKRTPKPGDLIFFGNNQKPAGINHVGIVVELQKNDKRIVYYDISNSGRGGRHYAPVGYYWICGYGMPDYESKDFSPAVEKVTLNVTVDRETAELLDIMSKGNNKTIGEIIDMLLEDAK